MEGARPCVIQMKRRLHLTSFASNVELAIQTNGLLTEQALRGVLPAVEELPCFESSVCHALGSRCLLEPP
jgi:hypothetical protein